MGAIMWKMLNKKPPCGNRTATATKRGRKDGIMIPQKISQCKRILAYMQGHGSISTLEALEYCGSFRLSARIKNLRDSGYAIQTVSETKDGKTYARYFLKGESDEQS